MKGLVIEVVSCWRRIAHRARRVAQVFLRDDFCRIAGCGFDGDACGKDATEVCDAEQKDEKHRQGKGELHQRLAATRVCGGVSG